MNIEDTFKDGLTQYSFEGKASFEVALQEIVALENKERSAAVLCYSSDRTVDNLGIIVQRRPERTFSGESPCGETLEKSAEVFLEYNDHGDDQNGKESLEDVFGDVQMKNPGDGVYHRKDEDPDQDEPRCRFLEPYQGYVRKYGDNGDIKKIGNPYGIDQLEKIVSHGTMFSKV